MRVLFVVNTFPPGYTGGAEVANYHTCRGLIRRGVDCSVLVLNNRVSNWPDAWYEVDGIPVHRAGHMLPRSSVTDVFDLWIYRLIKAELLRLRPDVVHIHNVSGVTLAPYLACRAVGVPVVNTLHDLWLLCPNNMLYRNDGTFCDPGVSPRGCSRCFRHYDFWGNVPWRRAIFARCTSNVAMFVCPSQALIERHVEAGYARERFHLVRLGFEEPVLEDDLYSNGNLIIEPDVHYPTLLFAGGGVEIKGASVLLQALPLLLQRVPQLRVLVAGGGEERFLGQFRRYAPAVQVLGSVPFREMRLYYALADLTIVASVWHENSPVVIYESYQAGTPVVGSRCGGIPELVQDGETGYLFPTGDALALADTVVSYLARPARERRMMRQRCVQMVRTHLTLEQHLSEIQQVYAEAVSR